uniref:Heparanase n=1 Tax=Spalax judaei TaxID=134510 RepID=C0MNC8_SPAJD|nr:heparanase [Nannospalax judaei]
MERSGRCGAGRRWLESRTRSPAGGSRGASSLGRCQPGEPEMLRLSLLLWLWGPLSPLVQCILAAQAEDVVELEFSTQRPLHLVSPSFLSITIDANLATDPRFLTFLGSPKLRALARGLSPAYLRFGGTKTDFLIFDPKKAHISIDGLQLGEDYIELRKLLRKSTLKNVKLYGPDVGQPRGKTVKLLRSFLKAGGEVIDSVTWHHYYLNGRIATKEDFLSPDVLDTFILSVQKILQVVEETRPGKKVWLGETSSAYGGGAPLLSNTFAAGFMWLDKLGLSAQMGIEVVMRQVFFGAGNYHLVDKNFEPLPDYWLSLLFKKLVGSKVLMARVKGPDRSKLRVYLHCTNINHPRYQEGDLTLYALNLYNVTKHLKLPYQLFNKPVDKYLVKPLGPGGLLSKSVQLNGQALKMVDDQTLPALTEKPLGPGSSLGLPAFSYGFFVIRNAKVAACI